MSVVKLDLINAILLVTNNGSRNGKDCVMQFLGTRLLDVFINVALSDIAKCHSKGDATSKRGKDLKEFFSHVN
jgi:hypothetical protein